jgi:hypothetical protein
MSQENQNQAQETNPNQEQQYTQEPPSPDTTLGAIQEKWERLVLDIYQTSTSAPLNQLICYLDYAVHGDEMTAEQALRVMESERSLLLNIKREEDRNGALTAFDEVERLKQTVAYITREFVREECGIWGAVFGDEDCDVVIAKVQQMAIEGKYGHCGTYWIANALAADGLIRPILPKRERRVY